MNGHGARAVFVDRDGVINVNRAEHVRTWSDLEFLPGALDGLALLARFGVPVVVVTNQAIVNRGLVMRDTLDRIHERMVAEVDRRGGAIRQVLICPHRSEEGCSCRKPAPGLLVSAAADLEIDPSEAVMIGDHPHDLEAARRAGCPSILVLSGRTDGPLPDDQLPIGCLAILPGLLQAARFVTGLVRDGEPQPILIGAR
jgi:D-glycero-D-manno-heptose 1,7-bisphosphate phosphatase